MSEELVKSVQEMLKEETWTRATISNYTKNNLMELSEIVEKARNENCVEEVKNTCDEQLAHTKDSIIALYISGMLGLKQGDLDNSSLVNLVDIFEKNHKESVVTYLCESILDTDPNNKFALRTLAEIYRNANDDKAWEIYEKIVKIDYEEAEIAKILAEHYENAGDSDNAIAYYKKALLRFVNAKNMTAVKETWTKLVSMIPDEIDFFLLVQRKIEKSISADKSALLMHDLYPYYKDNSKWDTAIDILKIILTIDPKDNWARNEIAACFKGKYADHSNVDEYIRSSNLNSSFRNVFEAISDFEKHIAFDAKNFVYHRTWGVGIIRKVENDKLQINFGKKNGVKEMSLKMAVSALQPLAKDHIWVLKATQSKEALVKKFKEDKDKSWALKTIIRSFGNSCDLKRIKAELVPSILTPGEWTSWNSAAKKTLESDPTFGINPNNINEYMVRDKKISTEEKLSNEFKAQKQFMPRVEVFGKYLDTEEADKENDFFSEMYNYFVGFLKAFSQVNVNVVGSYLVVQEVSSRLPNLAFKPGFSFAELYKEIDNPREMYTELKDGKSIKLQDKFLESIKLLPNWVDQYILLFPTVLKKSMLDDLVKAGQTEKVQKLAATAFENYKDYREAVLFFFENCQKDEWFKNANISTQKQLISIVNIIGQTYREIDNHIDTTENKKIGKNAKKLIFGDEKSPVNVFADYMLSCSQEEMTHLYTLVDDISELEPTIKQALRNRILEKYPDYKFRTHEEKSSTPKGMLVTKAKLDEKKALEQKMQTIDIPAIAKEVADAKEKGDLKENAEYIAAKEAQHKLNNDLKRLQGELARAQIFDPTTATTSMVSFGTIVVLTDNISGKDEKYTIMGPWESDPDAGIISYMSPFGNQILDSKVGETLEFTINEHKYNYTVKSIKLAK